MMTFKQLDDLIGSGELDLDTDGELYMSPHGVDGFSEHELDAFQVAHVDCSTLDSRGAVVAYVDPDDHPYFNVPHGESCWKDGPGFTRLTGPNAHVKALYRFNPDWVDRHALFYVYPKGQD